MQRRTQLMMLKRTVLLAALAIAGCSTSRPPSMVNENLLAIAGFRAQPADTPARQTALAAMPPARMVRRTKDGNVFYTLADPYNCKCLYVGNQGNYDQYKRLAREQQTPRNEPDAMAAPNAPGEMMGWNPETGLWGSMEPPEIGDNFR